MKVLSSIFIFFTFIYGDESFLSNSEYAKMLYHDPRGISCALCHGERGEGGDISSYVIELDGKKILKTIKAPKINDIDMNEFIKAFKKKKRYMPQYYLTEKELAYIYYYLIKQRENYETTKK